MESLTRSLILIYLKTVAGEALNEAERVQWEEWHAAHPGQELPKALAAELRIYEEVEAHGAARRERLRQRFAATFPDQPALRADAPRPLPMRPLFRIAAAAVVVAGLAVMGYRYWHGRLDTDAGRETAVVPSPMALPDTVITVTFPNGEVVAVGERKTGLIAERDGWRAAWLASGELAFSADPARQSHLDTIGVRTPSGLPVRVRLSDNSRVYLNAVSQLRFPAAFERDTRRVRFQGEGYFEVAHQAQARFYVVNGADSVEALGTAFSVRAHTDEHYKDIALVSGEVLVYHHRQRVKLVPREVLRIPATGQWVKLPKDLYELVAFKDGNFYYDSTKLETILADLSRWYKVPLVRNARLLQEGYYRLDTVPRSTPLPAVLTKLERTNHVRFNKDSKKIELIE